MPEMRRQNGCRTAKNSGKQFLGCANFPPSHRLAKRHKIVRDTEGASDFDLSSDPWSRPRRNTTSRTRANTLRNTSASATTMTRGSAFQASGRVWAQKRLGLAGRVRADDFLRLCENQHPATGETLTQRLNTTRADGDGSAANRRIFYDFTFSPPKSVSLAGFLGEDTRVLDAHARAVKSALREFEAFASTRIEPVASIPTVAPETLRLPCSLMTHRGRLIRICTRTASFSTQLSTLLRIAGRRFRITSCYAPANSPKTPTIMNSPVSCAVLGIAFVIFRVVIFRLMEFPLNCATAFSKRDAEIDKALAKLLADKPELAGSNIAELRARLATEKRTRKQGFEPR